MHSLAVESPPYMCKVREGQTPAWGRVSCVLSFFLSFDISLLSLRPHIFVNSWKIGSPWLRIASPALWFTAPGLSFSCVTLDKTVTPPSLAQPALCVFSSYHAPEVARFMFAVESFAEAVCTQHPSAHPSVPACVSSSNLSSLRNS